MQCAAPQQTTFDVPPDLWSTLARAALAAEGDSIAAWLRLRLVSRIWRDALAGVCLAYNKMKLTISWDVLQHKSGGQCCQ